MPKPIIAGPYRTFRRLNQEESYIEYEGSTITIPMKARGPKADDPWMEQEIKLNAFMRLEIYPPYVNNLGTREFQFTIRDWYLYGKSEMLNRLFFDDPRGYFVPGYDYVPATVVFEVCNHYHAVPDPRLGISITELFGDDQGIDIRNLTSHALRTWETFSERGVDQDFYTNPHRRIYWQIFTRSDLAKMRGDPKKDPDPLEEFYKAAEIARLPIKRGEPMMVFHKKQPQNPNEFPSFNLASARERIDYLLAATTFEPPANSGRGSVNRGEFDATLPATGHEENYTQLPGNSVLSSLYRPREAVIIRWSLNSKVKTASDVENFVRETLDRAKEPKDPKEPLRFGGYIQITSPARSLGTSDQGPDIGHPVDSTDFPARITYAINYNIYVNRVKFVEDNAGIAIAVGALEVPPRDVTVAFDKPHVGHVLSRYLEFGPGHCTGMHEIPRSDYKAGMNFARYWRTVPLDRKNWTDFFPYDPSKDY